MAALIKQSAKQLCYRRLNNIVPPPTPAQIEGEEHQQQCSSSPFREMRGFHDHSHFRVFYSFDEVFINGDIIVFKEHKNTKEVYDDWFFDYSVIQCAAYLQLANLQPVKTLETATFARKPGEEPRVIDFTGKQLVSILSMGERNFFQISALGTDVVDYFMEKLKTTESYKESGEWDRVHKFKDWLFLHDFIHINKIEAQEAQHYFINH